MILLILIYLILCIFFGPVLALGYTVLTFVLYFLAVTAWFAVFDRG